MKTNYKTILSVITMLSTYYAFSQTLAITQSVSANALCVTCVVEEPDNVVDSIKTNYAKMNLTVPDSGAALSLKLKFPSIELAGNYIGVVVEDTASGALDENTLAGAFITTYKNGIANLDTATSFVYSINQFDSTAAYKIEFQSTNDFDEVEVALVAGVSGAINKLRIYYAYTTTSPLPMTLAKFYAVAKQKDIELNWLTVAEINNDYFTVERSYDGKTFTPIAYIDAAGNSNTPRIYSHKDEDSFDGINYYRLKQTDFDGSFSYSSTIAAYIKRENNLFTLYPNPATDGINLIISADNTDIQILNAQGQVISSKHFDFAGQQFLSTQQLSIYRPGVYFVKSLSSGNTTTAKLLIN